MKGWRQGSCTPLVELAGFTTGALNPFLLNDTFVLGQ